MRRLVTRQFQTNNYKYFKQQQPLSSHQIFAALGLITLTGGALLTLTGGAYYLSHLEQVPFSKRSRFIAITEETESYLGEQAFQDILKKYRNQILPQNHPITSNVKEVADSLISVSSIKNKSWKLVVINDPLVNAFSIPGGKLVVFTGILNFANTKDKLAAVLGHEIAHQVARHSAESISSKIEFNSGIRCP